jgi:AAA domain-containing protein
LTALNVRLSALKKDGRRLLLIIDEAQNLTTEVLEGVRLLTNLGPADVQMIQIILCGQPGLRTLIDSPELVQLRQRIRVHYHLHTLSLKETKGYVTHRLEVAGCDRELFSDGAVARIHELSGGVPRLVNILADRGLLDAYVHGADHVDAKNISGEEIVRSPLAEVQSAATASAASETLPPIVEHESEPERDLDTIRAFEIDDDESDDLAHDEPDDSEPTRRRVLPWAASAAAVALVLLALVGWRLGWFASETDVPTTTPVAEVAAAVEDSAVVESSDAVVEASVEADTLAAAPVVDVAAVDIPTAEPVAEPEGLTPLESLDGIYIHVGSFQEMSRATDLAVACGNLDLDASICAIGIDGVNWLRVYVGPWQANGEAVETNTLLLNKRLTTWTMIVRFP